MHVTFSILDQQVNGETDLPSYHDSTECLSLRVWLQALQNVNQPQFDIVQLKLRTVISSQIGNRKAVQQIFIATAECQASEFTSSCEDSQSSNKLSAVVTFGNNRKSSSESTSSRYLLPNLTLHGSKYVTKHTALTDQHLVHGTCELKTWVSAAFYHRGSLIHRVAAPIEPKQSSRSIKLLGGKDDTQDLQFNVRAPGYFRVPWKQVSSEGCCLSIYGIDCHQQIQNDEKTSPHMEIPVRLGLVDEEIIMAHATGRLRADVEAKWIKTSTFRVPPDVPGQVDCCGSEAITTSLSSTSRAELSIPPCYKLTGNPASRSTTAVGLMSISIPRDLETSTFRSKLLSIGYEVELKLSLSDTAKKNRLYCAKLRVPCVLE